MLPRTHDLGREHSHGPRSVLQLVAGQLGHQPAGVFAVKAPVDVPFQFGRRNLPPPVVVAIPVVADIHHGTELALAHRFHDPDILGIEQPLLSHEKYLPRRPALPVHVETLLHGIGHGLLAKHVLPRPEGVERHPVMQVQRHGDDDGIDLRILQQAAVVVVALRPGSDPRRLVEVVRIVVAKGRDLGIDDRQQVAHVVLPA